MGRQDLIVVADDAHTYYTQRFGLGFDEIAAANLQRVNEEGEIISKTLGSKRASLLSHRGQLVAGRRSRKRAYSRC